MSDAQFATDSVAANALVIPYDIHCACVEIRDYMTEGSYAAAEDWLQNQVEDYTLQCLEDVVENFCDRPRCEQWASPTQKGCP